LIANCSLSKTSVVLRVQPDARPVTLDEIHCRRSYFALPDSFRISAYYVGMENQLSALGLVLNCVLLWNTVYSNHAIE
jgi:hypothetical protein